MQTIQAPKVLELWQGQVAQAFDHLSKPQAEVLALYSLGIVQAASAGLSSVAFVVAQWLGQGFGTVRERLRDWYRNAAAKTGRQRQELEVVSCFGPLLRWILQDWQGQRLALALDATSLSDRFVVLSISVLYRGAAVPVAWRILRAGQKQPWKPLWLQLLQSLKDVVPESMQVIVLADRGLYAKWLFEAIVALHWHPMLRINPRNAQFRPQGSDLYHPLETLLIPGECRRQSGTIFRSAQTRLDCTLLGCQLQGYEDPWFVLSDLAPEEAQVIWYGLRTWIERGFKLFKSGGWNWQETRMSAPAHAERLWLAMALASVYLLRYHEQPPPGDPRQPPLTTAAPAVPRSLPAGQPKPQRRILSLFRTGLLLSQLLLNVQTHLPQAPLIPEPWPDTPAQLHLHHAPSLPPNRSP